MFAALQDALVPQLVQHGPTTLAVVAVGVALWVRVGHLERLTAGEITRLRDRVHELSNHVAGFQASVGTLTDLLGSIFHHQENHQ